MNNNYHQGYQQAISPNYLIQNETNSDRQNQNGTIPQMYLENNLQLNIGKTATFHMSFPDSIQERDKVFYGEIAEAARDHIVIGNRSTDIWYMLPLTYLNYVEFKGKPLLFEQ